MSAEDKSKSKARVIEHDVATTPDGAALPRVLDKSVTMDVIQRYVETERGRNRRAMLWMLTLFLFSALAILVLFVSIGAHLIRKTSRATKEVAAAVEEVHEIRGKSAYVAAEVVEVADQLDGVTNSVAELVQKTRHVEGEVKNYADQYVSNDASLKNDLRRFRDWIAHNQSKDAEMVSALKVQLRDMVEADQIRRKELETMRESYSTLLSRTEERDSNSVSVVASVSGGEPSEVMAPADDLSFGDVRFEDVGPDVKGKPSGSISVVTFPNGDRYEGEFKGGFFDGWGTMQFHNGDRYEGQFSNDAMNGRGTYQMKNGDRYEGEFVDNMKSGTGRLLFRNGDRYAGTFSNDMINGKGTFWYANGNKYSGDFKNGLRDGNGTFVYANGDKYEGQFKNGLREGLGTYFFADGAKYIGQFKANKKNGDGRYIYANGQEYRGPFRDGKKHGEGLCIYPNGTERRVIWDNDKFVGDARK